MKKMQSILLVDDDEISNMLTAMKVNELAMTERVAAVTSGQQALDYCIAHCLTPAADSCPDLILLDINMPGMSGFEFLEKLNQLGCPRLPKVVVLTTSSSPRDVERARSLKVTGYIDKPLTPEKLFPLLED
ncbi:MAG: response regulator [Ferruginibacter sp.]|nr:response regulator [Cytophagales bacterium]